MSRFLTDHDVRELPIKKSLENGDQMIVVNKSGKPFRIIKGAFDPNQSSLKFVPTPAHSDSPGNVGEVAYENCSSNNCCSCCSNKGWFYIRTPEQWIRFKVNHTF